MSLAKKKKLELAKLTNDAKALYAEMEADTAKRTPENAEKFEKYLEDGKSVRAEVEKLEQLDAMSAYTGDAGGDEGKNGDPAAPNGGDGAFSQKFAGRKTYGELVIESDQFKNADRSSVKMGNVNVGNLITRVASKGQKALYNTTDTAGGYAVRAEREADILDIARQRPFTIMDLINVGQTNADAVEYVIMDSRTNNAAVVPEWDAALTPGVGDYTQKFGVKPQGNLTLDLKTAVVKTIAEWIAASRQILNDAPQLRSMIDNELMYQIEFVLENQIITGDGTGNNFTGILSTSGLQSRVHKVSGRGFTVNDTIADTLRRGITDIALEFYEADGVVVNPADGEKLELEKGSDGHYVQIYDPVAMRIWRKPVRESVAMTAGTAVVGAFKVGAKLWDREQSNIRVGEPGNFFIQNAVAVLAELRAAFAVVRPKALEKITGIV